MPMNMSPDMVSSSDRMAIRNVKCVMSRSSAAVPVLLFI